jgi:hypothetical protein
MLWKVAIHGGHLHPDFIREKLTDRQLHEIAWYYEMHPFGHDIDHMMLARVICSMAGGQPEDYIPKLQQPQTPEDMASSMPGMGAFLAENDIFVEEEDEYGDY